MNRNSWRALGAALTSAIACSLTSTPAMADSPCGGLQALNCAANNGGISTDLRRQELARARQGLDISTGAPDTRSFEYDSVYACPTNTPDSKADDVLCTGAITVCAGNTPEQGQGPQVRLYRREVDANGKGITGWETLGTTCNPDLVPGKKVLGMGPILAAFHNTPFAKPAVHIQPEGNLTLVTLDTFFEVKWPTAGFQPGEIDTTTLLGYQVRIRPTVTGYTYVFGDGTSFGPTPSPGGIYPEGDITHTYPKRGTYNTRIDTTYGGQFSVNGGAWLPIPDTATIAGPVQPLIVKTAHARLVAN